MDEEMREAMIELSKDEAGSDSVQRLVRLLELSAYKIWEAVLVGNPCKKVEEIYLDMQNPQPGDLVIERTTLSRAKIRGAKDEIEPRGIQGIGYLLKITEEPTWTPEAWAKECGDECKDPIPTEKVIYIQLFDGREIRWTNADVLKIPVELPKK